MIFVVTQGRELAVVDISKTTSVIAEDVIDTMTRLGMLKFKDGEHQIEASPVRHPPVQRLSGGAGTRVRTPRCIYLPILITYLLFSCLFT